MTRSAAALLFAAAAAAGTGSLAQEATLIAEEAAAIAPLEGHVRVVVRKVRGSLDLRRNETPGQIRFLSYTADAKRALLPVALWSDETTLRFEPRAGSEAVEHSLQIYLPQGLDVVLELEGTAVDASDLPGELDVRGRQLEVVARAIRGGVHADLEGGGATFSFVGRGVNVQARDVRLEVRDVKESVLLRLAGGEARVERVKGSTRAETEGTALTVDDAAAVSVKSRKGNVSLLNVAGADLSLSGSPLTLQRVRGEVDLQTDAEVRFTDCQTALHVDGYGASVFGVHNDGLVEVMTHNADVQLDRIDGPVRIQGEGLKVRLKAIEGETLVYVRGSEVEVEANKDHLVVDSAEGKVTVRQSTGLVEVRAVGGDVRLLDLRGPVDLRADSGDSEVSWAVLPTDRDSFLENIGGGLLVRFPAAGASRIEAQSRSGKIESELENSWIKPDGASGSALIGGGAARTIEIRSRWDVRLVGGPPRKDAKP